MTLNDYFTICEYCAYALMRRWWGRLVMWDMCVNTEFKLLPRFRNGA